MCSVTLRQRDRPFILFSHSLSHSFFVFLISARMDNKSYLVKMNAKGVQSKTAVNGSGIIGKSVHENCIHHLNVNGGLYPLKAKSRRQRWEVKPSEMANNTLNPIRAIVDGMKLTPHPDKPMIALSIGEKASSLC